MTNEVFRLLPAAGYRRMPWKNGGGETTEVIVEPSDASLDDFDWRISMARVETAGPFSRFPGVDRTLVVLEGEGLRLKVADRTEVTLDRGSQPYLFPADVAAEGTPIGGPILDYNVMTRRARLRHRLDRRMVSASLTVPLNSLRPLMISFRGASAQCHLGPMRLTAASGDSIFCISPGPARLNIAPAEALTLLLTELFPVASS